MDDSESSSVTSDEAEAQENENSRLARSFKNYWSKSPEDVADILRQWKEVKKEYTQKKAEYIRLRPKYRRLCRKMISYQANYIVNIKRIPSTIDLGQLSADQLELLRRALDQENKAGEATWKVYEIQKKMCAAYDAAEELIIFREEHFILQESEQQYLDKGKTAIASRRSECRKVGLKFMRLRGKMAELLGEVD
ncbi:uncharacterized protein M437DRAFT_66293 [Aureobasidium melanogenum CBS 110374]|uniref:Uncharacterized protein n=1 Tax=Aureobasidium melanogenum (strain CBS 110374) TaxID=1043003 RepID=A0A074VNY0_AURM1|nr:uncharacterized protein M437DRAFT_66293 [Aureobasidium melanogenum CBS 110374]KEQ62425.1 hypothetical protein M437DRAFT_66293 [Aureobasidium melanogenum CBS 110374]